jgi:hypothetical protein
MTAMPTWLAIDRVLVLLLKAQGVCGAAASHVISPRTQQLLCRPSSSLLLMWAGLLDKDLASLHHHLLLGCLLVAPVATATSWRDLKR